MKVKGSDIILEPSDEGRARYQYEQLWREKGELGLWIWFQVVVNLIHDSGLQIVEGQAETKPEVRR